jgi:hypothetical protein
MIFTVMSSGLFAQTYEDALRYSEPGITTNARALSLGNTYTVIGNDYSATIFNPATLGLARNTKFSVSVNVNGYANSANLYDNQTDFSNVETTFNQFGIIIPLADDTSKNFVLSLGYIQTKDFNRVLKFDSFNSQDHSFIQNLAGEHGDITNQLGLSYSAFQSGQYMGEETLINGNLQQSGYTLEVGGLNNWSVGASYEFATNIFFGGSVNYVVGNYVGDIEYLEEDTQNNYDETIQTDPDNSLTTNFNKFYYHETNDQVFNSWDFRFGVLYKAWNFIGIGASVKVPVNYTIIQNKFVTTTADYGTGLMTQVDTVSAELEYNLRTPYEFTLGAAVNLWIITGMAEISYIDYTQMSFTDGFDTPDRSLKNKEIKEIFTQTFNLKAGVEFRLPWTGISARAGAQYQPSPYVAAPQNIQGEYTERSSYDKIYLSAGIGLRSGDNLSVDLGATYGFWDDITDNYGVNLSRVFQNIELYNIIATVSFGL